MLIYLYHLAWSAGILLSLPAALLLGKGGRLLQRLAPRLPAGPLKNGRIWIHALSVGEALSAFALVKRLGATYPDKEIVFTVTTSQGLPVARQGLGGFVRDLLPLPLDFWWTMRRFVAAVDPDLFILVETDIWPGLLDLLKRRGTRSILVNGRISPKTFISYRRYAFVVRRMFENLDLCLMQSDLDRERLLRVGLDPERILAVGNLKFDHDRTPMSEGERARWLLSLGLSEEDIVWVAGSTHRGEEEILLQVQKRLRRTFPVRLILAPRRIEQAGEILDAAEAAGLKARLRSDAPGKEGPPEVLVLDTLGELGRVYGVGVLSFVGGSLVPVGGHNLLEPAFFGQPVLFGPHTQNFAHMSERLEELGGGWRVRTEEELYRAMETLLQDAGLRDRMGRAAETFVELNRGALERVMGQVSRILE